MFIFFQFDNKVSIWTRQVLPTGSLAVAFLYTKDGGYPIKVTTLLADVGLKASQTYDVYEVFDNVKLGQYRGSQNFTCTVNPTGVYLIKATPVQQRSDVTKVRTASNIRQIDVSYLSRLDKLLKQNL